MVYDGGYKRLESLLHDFNISNPTFWPYETWPTFLLEFTMLSRSAVVDAIAAANENMSKAEAARILQAALNGLITVITEQVEPGESLHLRGLGTFKKVLRKGGLKRNPKTGEGIQVPDKIVLKVVPAKDIKAVVAE